MTQYTFTQYSIQALTSRSNTGSNHIFSPSDRNRRIPLVQSKTTNIGYNQNHAPNSEQVMRSKTWDDAGIDESELQMNGIGDMASMDRAITGPATLQNTPMYQHYNSTPNTPLRRPLKVKRKMPKIHPKSRSRPAKASIHAYSDINQWAMQQSHMKDLDLSKHGNGTGKGSGQGNNSNGSGKRSRGSSNGSNKSGRSKNSNGSSKSSKSKKAKQGKNKIHKQMNKRGVSHGLNMVTINGGNTQKTKPKARPKMKYPKSTKAKVHKPFRVDRDTDDEETDSQLPMNQKHHEKILSMTSTVASMAAGSVSDSFKDPFMNQQPRKYIRKSFMSSADGDVIYESDDGPKMKFARSTPHRILSARRPPPPSNGGGQHTPHPMSLGMYNFSILSVGDHRD